MKHWYIDNKGNLRSSNKLLKREVTHSEYNEVLLTYIGYNSLSEEDINNEIDNDDNLETIRERLDEIDQNKLVNQLFKI